MEQLVPLGAADVTPAKSGEVAVDLCARDTG